MLDLLDKRILSAPCLALLLLLTAGQAGAINILFYGNSYTNAFTSEAPRSVPDLVQEIATVAGQTTPNAVNAAVNGKSFAWHMANNTAIIGSGLSAGEQWDVVVMQNFSTRPTVSHSSGNLAQHRANSVSLYQAVANHSPGVQPVLFETWARALGSSALSFFVGGQTQMQQELRDGYNLAADDIDAAAGLTLAKVAPVGDAWERASFNNLHLVEDKSHANRRGRVLTALVIYSTIYGDNTHDLFLSGALDATFASMSLTSADGGFLTGISDATTTVIPEPGALAVTLVGLAGMALRRRQD